MSQRWSPVWHDQLNAQPSRHRLLPVSSLLPAPSYRARRPEGRTGQREKGADEAVERGEKVGCGQVSGPRAADKAQPAVGATSRLVTRMSVCPAPRSSASPLDYALTACMYHTILSTASAMPSRTPCHCAFFATNIFTLLSHRPSQNSTPLASLSSVENLINPNI